MRGRAVTSSGANPGDKVIVGIRPEYFAESEDGIEGTAEIVEHLGTTSLVTLTTEGPRIQVTVPEGHEPDLGATLRVTPRPGRMLVYRADDGELDDAP
jgi:multiple sugar transport system ATP-binding protein